MGNVPFLAGARRVLVEAHHPAHLLFAFGLKERLDAAGAEMRLVVQGRPEALRMQKSLGLVATTYPARRKGLGGAVANLRRGWSAVAEAIDAFKPDRLLSIAGVYTAFPARRRGISNALIQDTETATLSHLLAYPFADLVLHPKSYRLPLDRVAFLAADKRRFFEGRQEASYACSEAFLARLDAASVPPRPFALIRAIAWQAYHEERNRGGWSEVTSALERAGLAEIVASLETETPALSRWAYRGDALQYHSHLRHATLVVTEGATTATECALYGTPAIFVNANLYGTLEEACRAGRVRHARTLTEAAAIISSIDAAAWRSELAALGPFTRSGPLDLLFA